MIFVEVVGESSQKTKRCVSGESCRWIHVIQVVTTQSLWVFNGEFWHIQKRVYHFECQHDKTSSSSKWCQLLLASPPQWCHEFWAMSVPCCEVAATELQLFVITGLPSRTLQWNIPHQYILQVCLHLNHVNPGSINLVVFFFVGVPLPSDHLLLERSFEIGIINDVPQPVGTQCFVDHAICWMYLHVWYIYLQNCVICGGNVGKHSIYKYSIHGV